MTDSDDPYKHQHIVFSLLRILLGLFMLWTGIAKIRALNSFIDDVARFDVFPVSWEPWIAYLGISCEIVVGVCLIFKKFYLAAVCLACAMFSVFVTLFVQAWARGLSLSCHCTGFDREVQSYPFEVAWRLGLLLAGLALLWDIYRKHTSMFVAQQIHL